MGGADDPWFLAAGVALDLGCAAILVGGIARKRAGEELTFTGVMLNVLTFALITLLDRAPLGTGLGFGLFAIFGLLRYRTRSVEIQDLTWMFALIALAVVNGVGVDAVGWAEVLALDGVILAVAAGLALARGPGLQWVDLRYDRVDLLPAGRAAELRADLQARLGVPVQEVRIGTVDLLKGLADVQVGCAPGALGTPGSRR